MAELDHNGSLAATGSGDWFAIDRGFYLVLSGTWVGSVALEASVDGGVTAINCLMPDGSASAYTSNGLIAVPNVWGGNVRFRVTFTRTSGTLEWRMSR